MPIKAKTYEYPAPNLNMFGLQQIKDSAMRFLGIVRLTPEQKKLLEEMDKDYEKTLGQKKRQQKSTSPSNQTINENNWNLM